MTHRSDAMKSVIQNHILTKFCVGGDMKFKNFDFNLNSKLKLLSIDMHVINIVTLELEILQMF